MKIFVKKEAVVVVFATQELSFTYFSSGWNNNSNFEMDNMQSN